MELLLLLLLAATILLLPPLSLILVLVTGARLRRLERRVLEVEAELRQDRAPAPTRQTASEVGEASAVAEAEPTEVEPGHVPAVTPVPAAPSSEEPPRPGADTAPIPAPTLSQRPSLALDHPSPSRDRRSLDWESLVGVRLFSWIAGLAVVVAAVLFLRYSIDQGWLQPPVRMAIGLITGTALLALCELKVARRYRVTANALDGAAIAVLFATFFASHALWALVPAAPAFVMMAVVAAAAVVLSVRRDSLFIALLGLVSAFATPFLLSTGLEQPATLFAYLLILNAGLLWVANHRGWPALSALAVVLTAVHQWVWVVRSMTAGQVGVGIVVFLLFPAVACVGLAMAGSRGREQPWFLRAVNLSAVLPILLAFHLAAVPAYGERWGLLFGFLFALVLGLLAVALWRGPQWLHAMGGGAAVIALAVWFARSYVDSAWPGVLVWLSVFVLLFLAAPWLARRLGRPFVGLAARTPLISSLLLAAIPALIVVEVRCAWAAPVLATLLLLQAAVAADAMASRRSSAYWAGGVVVVIAQVVWSIRHLSAEQRGSALTMWLVCSLFFLAVASVARRWSDRKAMGVHLALVAYGFFVAVAAWPVLADPPDPLLIALAVLAVAVAAAAVGLGVGSLQVASVAGTGVVLLALVQTLESAAWPRGAVLAAALMVGLSVAVAVAGRFVGATERQVGVLAAAAVLATFLGQAVIMTASVRPGAPGLGLVMATHSALVITALAVACWRRWGALAVLAAPIAFAGVVVWQSAAQDPHWSGRLCFMTLVYLPFLAFPMVIGRRTGAARWSHVAAVLASGFFLVLARAPLVDAGLGGAIGLLPLVQAGLTAVLLAQVLRLEPEGERDALQQAIVIGSIIALVTVAVPMQLSRQWLTIGWALEGLVLLAVGVRAHSRFIRLTAILLLVVTVCKAFLYDLARLGGLYRVVSFVGLAVSLALVALALQRFVLSPPEE